MVGVSAAPEPIVLILGDEGLLVARAIAQIAADADNRNQPP